MKLAVISFTERGSRLNASLVGLLEREGFDCEGFGLPKYAKACGLYEAGDLAAWTKEMFSKKDALLFIGAAGIAVRSIAPYLEHKSKDPAVVVMDEKGIFVISLLSGHLGGANELAGRIANLTGAIPVITTATDVNGRFAVDLFAKKNQLSIASMELAKQVSADVLDEKKVGFYSDFPVIGQIPDELVLWDGQAVFEGTNGICVTLDAKKQPYRQTLHLIPRIVSVGIGCKKDTEYGRIRQTVYEVLEKNHISIQSVEKIASIDLKAKEPGILALAEECGAKFVTYSAEELKHAKGAFSRSAFVESVTGVDNVCERSAALASQNGRRIGKKEAQDGVTVALAVRDWSVEF